MVGLGTTDVRKPFKVVVAQKIEVWFVATIPASLYLGDASLENELLP